MKNFPRRSNSGCEPLCDGGMLFVQALDLILLVMSDVAADEHAAERHRGAQHNENAGGRIDDRSPGFVTAPIK